MSRSARWSGPRRASDRSHAGSGGGGGPSGGGRRGGGPAGGGGGEPGGGGPDGGGPAGGGGGDPGGGAAYRVDHRTSPVSGSARLICTVASTTSRRTSRCGPAVSGTGAAVRRPSGRGGRGRRQTRWPWRSMATVAVPRSR